MKDKISLVVIFGGVSSEHEVSCKSASSVLEHIDREKYSINTIGITKEGNWFLTGSPVVDISDGTWVNDKGNIPVALWPHRSSGGFMALENDGTFRRLDADVVFPVLHGRNGEDGTMQGLLQILGIPFVGSDTVASAASMDKAVTKAMIEQAGVACQAKCHVLNQQTYIKDKTAAEKDIMEAFQGKLPLFVKPANAGSSVGISKVKSTEELSPALSKAFKEDSKVVVEETVIGREIEVAVLGNEEPKASCIGEIFAANEFYDYDAKYENAASKTGIVRDLSDEKEREIRDTAVRVYEAMGCRGLSRVDFFLEESGRVVFNEINTLPGFTSISMYPQLWEESGISYSCLIDELIRLAMEK